MSVGSTVFWEEVTASLIENTAVRDGGAVVVSDSSSVSWEAEAYFIITSHVLAVR